jgi:tetratricopeptide (TPR) repeat protein
MMLLRLALFVLLVLLGAPALAQPSDTLFLAVGKPVPRVAAAADTSQTYALYLPSGYDGKQVHPVLFLMDPRGRAMLPIERFRASADRLGFILLSSHHTLSDADSAFAINGRALHAIIQDAQLRFSVDTRRFYLVGFSGTAHFAWFAAPFLDGHLAGIINAGDGLPPEASSVRAALAMTRPPAYFGAAGLGDFNYDAARRRDAALDSTRVPHRFVGFEGDHEWMPETVASEAIDWMEFQAMRTGMARYDASWVDSLRLVHLAEAKALDDAGRWADAIRRYREVIADFEGRGDIDAAQERLDQLLNDPAALAALEARAALARRIDAYNEAIVAFVDDYRKAERVPRTNASLDRLEIKQLRAASADTVDIDLAGAARRMLATVYASVSFYEARDYLAAADYERAAGMLRIARAIRPGGFVCYQLAQAEAQLGRADAAFSALECAVDTAGIAAEVIERDTLLTPIRGDRRYRALLVRATM